MTVMSRLATFPSLLVRLASPVNHQPSQKFRLAVSKCSDGFRGRGSSGMGLGRKSTQNKSTPKQVKSEKPVETHETHSTKDSSSGHHGAEIGRSEFTSLGRYFLYTALSLPVMYTGCVIWRYENMVKYKEKMLKGTDDLTIKKEGSFRQRMNALFKSNPDYMMVLSMIGINVFVCALWRIPALVPTMRRYFTCLPARGYSVLGTTLSGFSHQAFIHLFVNMYVLQSFAPIAMLTLGGKEHFLSLFLSGATVSALCSSIYKVKTRTLIPSVGASGGIMAIIALVAMAHPKAELSIAFVNAIIPHSFTAQKGLAGIITLEMVCLLCGWRLLDHAAHLGGVLFGIFYYKYGKDIWLGYQKFVLKRWHYIRTGEKRD